MRARSHVVHATRRGASIKELLTGIVIAFTMAFIFRGFVVEGFVIPTGSMAPTLLGKHMRVTDEQSGFRWTVGPWDYGRGAGGTRVPMSPQGTRSPIVLNDPMTGREITRTDEPLLAGDRLFVMKYLDGVHEPARWDVIVFKVPTGPQENFIKRLVGMPGEQLAIADGDIFTRPTPDDAAPGTGPADWADLGWTIARKPERVQREVLQPVFDSRYTPPDGTQEGLPPSRRFRAPWESSDRAWTGLAEGADVYRYEGDEATVLEWDDQRFPLDDYTSYNQLRNNPQPFSRRLGGRVLPIFPVSDVAVTFAVEPESTDQRIRFELTARGREFRGVVGGGTASVGWRPAGGGDWIELDDGETEMPPGKVTNVEFWHIDQALWLFVAGELIAGGSEDGGYDLTPAERVEAATGTPLHELLARSRDELARPSNYTRPELRVALEGGPVTLRRSVVARDIFYQPRPGDPGRASRPSSTATMSGAHYLFFGDNSANSQDARAWDFVDPWVTSTIHDLPPAEDDPFAGMVHRDLLIGRAFLVYLPSPVERFGLPMLDFGRMRWVW